MKILKIAIIVTIVMTFYTKSLAKDNNQSYINYSIFWGYGYYNYYEINNQFDTYHQINGITFLPNIGAEFEYYFKKCIVKNLISTSYYNYENKDTWREQEISYWNIQDQLIIGYFFINNQYNRFFPFTGVLVQYQVINTDFNYGAKCIDCFFQYKHKYSNFNSGFLYGISYELHLPFNIKILKNTKLSIDAGGIISIQNKKWYFDGKEIENTEYTPEGNFNYFINPKLIYQF